jgi:hypothetical protein
MCTALGWILHVIDGAEPKYGPAFLKKGTYRYFDLLPNADRIPEFWRKKRDHI